MKTPEEYEKLLQAYKLALREALRKVAELERRLLEANWRSDSTKWGA